MKNILKYKWLIAGAGAIAVWYFFLRDEPKDKSASIKSYPQIHYPPEKPTLLERTKSIFPA